MAAGRIVLALVASLIVGVGVGGCVGPVANAVRPTVDAHHDTDSLTDGSESTASDPVGSDPTDADQWIIDFHSVGPIQVGSSTVSSLQSSMTGFEQHASDNGCPWVAWYYEDPLSLALPLEDDYSTVEIIDFANWTNHEVIGPRTREGIGLGSTFEAMMAAYPDITRTGDYGPEYLFYGITDGSGWIVFSVTDGFIGRITVGPYDTQASEYCG